MISIIFLLAPIVCQKAIFFFIFPSTITQIICLDKESQFCLYLSLSWLLSCFPKGVCSDIWAVYTPMTCLSTTETDVCWFWCPEFVWLVLAKNLPSSDGRGPVSGGSNPLERAIEFEFLTLRFFYFGFSKALFLACLNFFSSSESLAILSDMYSWTLFQPTGDLSAMRNSLFLFFNSSLTDSYFFLGLALAPLSINSNASLLVSYILLLNSNWV